MAGLSQENEARLRTAIAEYDLQIVEDLIVENAVECATLSTNEPDNGSVLGVSRYGGRPDLPRDLEWPRSDFGGRPLDFILQINFAEVPAFTGKQLPDRGTLYVFYDDGELILRYSPTENPDDLIATTDNDEFDLEDELKPFRVSIEATIDLPEWTSDAETAIKEALGEAFDDPREAEDRYDALAREMRGKTQHWAGKLQGHPAWIGYVPDDEEAAGVDKEWILLLWLDSNRDVNSLFGDAGYVLASIPQDDLAQKNFDNIQSQLESS
jgi:uncharacterized protein YwqG